MDYLGIYTAISDEFPICRKYSITTRVIISLIPFITSLPTVTYAGKNQFLLRIRKRLRTIIYILIA
jgi:hypothetical protein